jgi:hypothetical protein
VANSNPNHATRFKPGASANPGGKPRPKPPADPASGVPPGQERPAAIPGQTIHERVVAKLEAILSDPDAELGYQLAACRLLASDELASTIRDMEHGHTEEQARLGKIRTAVGLVLTHHPEVGPELAEQFVRACLEAMEPTNLTDTLRDRLGMWKAEPLTDGTLCEIWHDLSLPGDPGPELSPCGFKELPPPASPPCGCGPAPDPDREFLARRAVEDERARREKLKHPAAPPPTPFRGPEVQVVTPEQEAQELAERDRAEQQRQEQARRLVWFGDLPIDPFGGL